MVPVSGSSSPAMARNRVDLPDPLGPSSAVRARSGPSKSMLSSATKSPYRLLAPRTVIAFFFGTSLLVIGTSPCEDSFCRPDAPGVEDDLRNQHDDGDTHQQRGDRVGAVLVTGVISA